MFESMFVKGDGAATCMQALLAAVAFYDTIHGMMASLGLRVLYSSYTKGIDM